VITDELALIEAFQKLGRDALVVAVTALAFDFGPEAKSRAKFLAAAFIAIRREQANEAVHQIGVIFVVL